MQVKERKLTFFSKHLIYSSHFRTFGGQWWDVIKHLFREIELKGSQVTPSWSHNYKCESGFWLKGFLLWKLMISLVTSLCVRYIYVSKTESSSNSFIILHSWWLPLLRHKLKTEKAVLVEVVTKLCGNGSKWGRWFFLFLYLFPDNYGSDMN